MRLSLRLGPPGVDGLGSSTSSDPDEVDPAVVVGSFTHQPSFSTISSADTEGDAMVVTPNRTPEVLPSPNNAVVVSLVRHSSKSRRTAQAASKSDMVELALSLDLARLEVTQQQAEPASSSATSPTSPDASSPDATSPSTTASRAPIPIPPALAALPLFDTFFDLVEADAAGGIQTPTPPRLLASVHELVQSITSSESQPPETWVLAREWRDAVRAAQRPNDEHSEGCEEGGVGGECQRGESDLVSL